MVSENDIQNYLLEEGMLKEKANDPNAEFHYVVQYPEGNMMDVLQPKGKTDVIIIGCATQVAPEHVSLISTASDDVKKNFILDVKLNLNKFGVDFNLDIQNYIINQYIVTDQVFTEDMKKADLIEKIKNVFRAKIQCIWLMEKSFDIALDTAPANPNNKPNENSMFV